MKRVILNSLTLCNFKGEQNRTTTFNKDITTISGANGLGKSRHFDAFLWLLFGKDKENRADYEVKTHDASGNTIPEIDVVVTGVLSVGNETITLTRKLVENWVTPKMSKDRVFKGNETRCFWNDVPVTVTEYKERVNGIIDETVFKMVTNPLFFASMDWKKQREQLFAMAGRVNDDDIAENNAEFRALLDKMNGKSFDDFKAEIHANKTNLRKELNEIQPRIDQTERMKPEKCDWIALEKDLDACNAAIAELDAKLAELNRISNDRAAAANAKFEETRQLRRDLMDCASRMDAIVNDAVRKERARVIEANAKLRDMKDEIERRKATITQRQNKVNANTAVLASINEQIVKLTKERDEKRAEWFDVNDREFNDNTVCPICGQPFPEHMLTENRAKFAEQQKSDLETITEAGKRITSRIEALNRDKESNMEYTAAMEKDIEECRLAIAELETKVAACHEESEKDIDPASIPEWVDKKRVYDQLSAKIDAASKSAETGDTADVEENNAKIAETTAAKTAKVAARDEIKTKLNNRTMIERADAEIASLRESGRKLAQSIADIERDEYVIGQFTKAKVDLVESRVSGLFTRVKWKMFNYTIDGNAIETCVAMVDGVPFPTVNTADQINAGLDIINALCDYYDVSAPIFIDNRESVNQLIPTGSQIINLVVTRDPELVIS